MPYITISGILVVKIDANFSGSNQVKIFEESLRTPTATFPEI